MDRPYLFFVVEDAAMIASCRDWRDRQAVAIQAGTDFAKSMGSEGYFPGSDEEVVGLVPTDPVPAGWKVRNVRGGKPIMEPIAGTTGKAARAALAALTQPPSHEELRTMINHPCVVSYEYDGGSGTTNIGHFGKEVQLLWAGDTFVLYAPDPAPTIQGILAQHPGAKITNGEWTPPAGLRRISEAKWHLMLAQYQVDLEESNGTA